MRFSSFGSPSDCSITSRTANSVSFGRIFRSANEIFEDRGKNSRTGTAIRGALVTVLRSRFLDIVTQE
jgi:hypothetical protein